MVARGPACGRRASESCSIWRHGGPRLVVLLLALRLGWRGAVALVPRPGASRAELTDGLQMRAGPDLKKLSKIQAGMVGDNDTSAISKLMSLKAKVNEKDSVGLTPLHVASVLNQPSNFRWQEM